MNAYFGVRKKAKNHIFATNFYSNFRRIYIVQNLPSPDESLVMTYTNASGATHDTGRKLRFLVLLTAILLVSCASHGPEAPRNIQNGDFISVERFAAALSEQAITGKMVNGLSIALVNDQRIVFARGFGYADTEAKVLASADTLYRVGSISKLLTDVAAMQLVESGKLDLDYPIQKILPGFTPRSWDHSTTDITPRMLMSHHSGLQRDVLKSAQSSRPPRFTEIVEKYNNYLSYQPGQFFAYSNVGLSVLGAVVEHLSTTRFEDYLQHSVLDPLGMEHSSFDVASSNSSYMAKSYSGSTAMPSTPLRDVPAGGLNSNVNDLSRFLSMVFADGMSNGKRVLGPESIVEMFRQQNQNVILDLDTPMGLGWFLQNPESAQIKGGGWVASHQGALDGFRSVLMVLPQQKLGVVVLSNSASGARISQSIASQVLKVALEAKTGTQQPERNDTDFKATTTTSQFINEPITAEKIQRWVGDYTTKFGHIRIVSKDGVSLQISALGYVAALQEREDGQFGLSYKLLGILPTSLGPLGDIGFTRRILDGREVIVANDRGRVTLVGERLTSKNIDSEIRQFVDTYSGMYEVVPNGDEKLEVRGAHLFEDKGIFIAEIHIAGQPKPQRLVLRPVGSGMAIALGSLADRGDAVIRSISSDDGKMEVQALGLRFRKVGPYTNEPL